MINAEEFAKAGEKYLGRPYDRKEPGGMDCQDFFEQCAKDCGLNMDLAGSNAWYRKFLNNGWTGSPEECKKVFGCIPKGTALFIHAFDGGEQKRGYFDNLGNASHIGIKTGTGKGAIHSSATRGCVAESEFKDKTIRGGWNMVGLSRLFDYGDKINRILSGGDGDAPPWDDDPGEGEDDMPEARKATVYSANGKPVKMRESTKEPKKGQKTLYDDLPVGTVVDVVGSDGEWSKVNYKSRKGWWIKTAFLIFDEDGTPAEDDPLDPGDDFPDDPDDGDVQPGDMVVIRMKAADAVNLYTIAKAILEQIEEQVGRG